MKPKELGDAYLVGTFEHDTPEWHEARSEQIGGSDIASILGLSTWKSAYTLWHEKAGLIVSEPPSLQQRRKQAYGHHMEPFVEQLFLEAHTEYRAEITGTWRNLHRPWQGCNPDRILWAETGPTLLQIKTANFATDWEDGPPAGYLAQIKWELDTFGFEEGWLVAYFNVGGQFMDIHVDIDDFEIRWMREQAKLFAESITAGTPPELDGSGSTLRTIARLNPSIAKGTEQEIPEAVAAQYLAATINMKECESDLNLWKGHLLAHMGTAQYATFQGQRIARREARGAGVPYLKET